MSEMDVCGLSPMVAGRLDVLVNSADIAAFSPLGGMTTGDFMGSVRVNQRPVAIPHQEIGTA